jgi:hypothetical protein
LKSLAAFIADVAVVGMQLFQLALKGINLGGGESVGRDIALRCPDGAPRRPYLRNTPHDVQHIQCPAAFGAGNLRPYMADCALD